LLHDEVSQLAPSPIGEPLVGSESGPIEGVRRRLDLSVPLTVENAARYDAELVARTVAMIETKSVIQTRP